MIEYENARRTMVDSQLRTADVVNVRILDAFLHVPREAFLPESTRPLAYLDTDLVVKDGHPPRRLLQPMVLARLLQAADIALTDTVLDVGSARGYSAAILSRIGGKIVALEADPELADAALHSLSGSGNVVPASGPLQAGWPEMAPYDVIVLEGAVEVVPPVLLQQLGEGGRLVAVVGYGRTGRATVFVKSQGDVAGRVVFDAVASPLPGFAAAPTFAF
jgi:protein-L-isoaspartate(D-aspartate) O-methyltransferase